MKPNLFRYAAMAIRAANQVRVSHAGPLARHSCTHRYIHAAKVRLHPSQFRSLCYFLTPALGLLASTPLQTL